MLASDGKSITSSSTLTTSEVLRNEDGNGVIKLRLGKEGSIWGVSFAAGSVVEGDKEKKGNGKDKQFPTVQVLEESLEPKVFLGKPVELNAEGKIKEEVKEKTLLQK